MKIVTICVYIGTVVYITFITNHPRYVFYMFHILKSLDNVPEHRFFVVYEWQDKYEEATKQLGEWVKQGVLKYKECVGEGISQAPSLFRGMLKGKNFGKQLVKIADL